MVNLILIQLKKKHLYVIPPEIEGRFWPTLNMFRERYKKMLSKHHLLQKKERKKERVDKHCGQSDILYSMCEVIVPR